MIRFANNFSKIHPTTQENQFYTILVVISKADNVDTVATKDAIVESAKNPLSVIIVAVGEFGKA